MSNSVQPHRRQPTRLPRPWDSPGKNTGVDCHFLLQCMKVKSLSRVQLLATPWTVAHQAPPSMGFSRQEYWSGVPSQTLVVPKATLGTLGPASNPTLLEAGSMALPGFPGNCSLRTQRSMTHRPPGLLLLDFPLRSCPPHLQSFSSSS